MTTLTMPTVLAFNRKLEPSDALMYSGNWQNISSNNDWEPIELFERRNRAVKSNFKAEVFENVEDLQKQISEANLSWGDDAALTHNSDTLKISFTLRIVADLIKPSVCNKAEFEAAYREKIGEYINSDLKELSSRYAYNIANGRFLWRNRVGAQAVKVVVSHVSLTEPLIFNAYDFSLKKTSSDDASIQTLAELINDGLIGNDNTLIKINAYVQLGEGQRVWPSQEMVKAVSGQKSRHLFSLNSVVANKHAAMHCEKIGNALRTIDDWYPDHADIQTPIAIEAYGSVTQRGVAYRSTRNDFKSLLLKWLNAENGTALNLEEKNFVVAMLIRGGVFGEGES